MVLAFSTQSATLATMKLTKPTLTGGDLTPSYIAALLAGTAESHIDSLQNAALCNTIRNDGKLIVKMGGNQYSVTPHYDCAQSLVLSPLTVTLNGAPVSAEEFENTCFALGSVSEAKRALTPLKWGWGAFQSGIIDGSISLNVG